MADPKALLISLRPRHAGAIIEGRKTVELRRRRVGVPAGTNVILYASSPVKAVVGTARIQGSRVCSPDMAWQQFSSGLGLARHEFDAYLDGMEACVLLLDDVRRVDPPLTLAYLRRDQPFQPPQSYRYLTAGDPPELRSLPHMTDASNGGSNGVRAGE